MALPLIDELTSQIDASAYTPFEKRYPGRVSELLLDVWLKTNGQDVVELPLTSPEPTDWWKRARASSWPSSPVGNTRRASDLYRQIRKESKILVHFVFIISVFTIYLDYSAHKDISSPVIVFTSLWLFICTLASLRLYGFTGYSEKTIGYITCGSMAFSLGAFSSTLVNKQTTKQTRYAHLRGKIFKRATAINSSYALHFLK